MQLANVEQILNCLFLSPANLGFASAQGSVVVIFLLTSIYASVSDSILLPLVAYV